MERFDDYLDFLVGQYAERMPRSIARLRGEHRRIKRKRIVYQNRSKKIDLEEQRGARCGVERTPRNKRGSAARQVLPWLPPIHGGKNKMKKVPPSRWLSHF